MKLHTILIITFLLFSYTAFAVDADGDGSDAVEEALAGTSDADPNQRPYWWKSVFGDLGNDMLGESVSAAGDVNGDGYGDILVGIIGDDNTGPNAGAVRVFSGIDGSSLYTVNGQFGGNEFGVSVSKLGDVDNDGYDDFIVGSEKVVSSDGAIYVFSGVNGSLIYKKFGSLSSMLGSSISMLGDVNFDGYTDFIAGAKNEDNAISRVSETGGITVFNGLNGEILYQIYGEGFGDEFGGAVSSAGDVNNDGYPDFIVGAKYDDNNGVNSGSAQVYSGLNGALLFIVNGDNESDLLGYDVRGLGDVNGDGYKDFAASAVGYDGIGSGSGMVRVYSGYDASTLYTLYGEQAGQNFGVSVSGIGDLNNDANDDVIVGSGFYDEGINENSGLVQIYSGIDGAELYRLRSFDAGIRFGHSVSEAGDVDGDGYDDLVVGTPFADNNGNDSGIAKVYRLIDLLADRDTDYYLNGSDAFPDNSNEWVDTDSDGIGNNSDWDDDNDGVPDVVDADPLDNANINEIDLPLDREFKGKSIGNQAL